MYLQCQADISGHAEPYRAYSAVTIRAGNELRKIKKRHLYMNIDIH